MKKYLLIPLTASLLIISACKKKEKGTCYCEYYSGEETHYDLSALPRNQQEDSCKVIDNNAEAFAGDCELK